MLRLPQRHPLPLAFAALALLALPAAATTIVPMRDSALVDRARLVVVAETVDVLPVVDERPATDYLMRIERVLKGEVAAGSLVVRVPGGFTPDGRELRLYGAPRFQAGERALLFLGPERDGSYRILQFLQGAFHRARLAGRDVAYRDESEVQRLAERSAQATRRIGAIVKTIQSDTQDAVNAMEASTQGVVEGTTRSDAAGQSLAEIEAVSEELARLIQSISEATQAQAGTAQRIAGNMRQILDVTEQASDGARRSAESIGQLAVLSNELKVSVSGFKL